MAKHNDFGRHSEIMAQNYLRSLGYTIFAKPEDAVNFKKIKNIVRAANTYLISHNIENDSRFDIITLLLMPSGEYKIEHIKDAFIAPLGI